MSDQPISNNFGTPLLNFQLDQKSIKDKSDIDYGRQLAEYIQSTVNGGSSSYFWVRNQRWKTNRNYAAARINMSRFRDLLEFNGKVNYLNINWQCIHIVNSIISGLVGMWMNRSEKIAVTAIDTLSTTEKQDQYDQLEFVLDNKAKLEQLQQAGAPQLIPDELPEDKDSLRLWQAQFQRLPEEILYELGCNDVLGSCGWFDVLKEKMLHDSAETGFVATYTWMDDDGVIHVEWLKPENCFYSYSNYPDFRDTTWRGYMRTMKISELRKKYGKEFNPDNPNALDEGTLFKMARTAKEYQLYDNVTWITEWNVTFLRPYDEWNVDVIEFELKTVDTESYTVVTTKKNNSTIIKKGKPKKKADNEEVIDDSKINIYRGVYARSTLTMLEWGLKRNMVRPQDPKEIGNAEFSYSFYMVQNYDMTCLGIPEKIQEPVDQMIIARFKMQQLVMKMRPVGAAVNWDALQNIDYGLGDANKTIDVKKLFDQTGDLFWRGKDAEGNPIPVPIQELQNAGFLNQLQGLIMLYDKHLQIIRDEIGVDPSLMTQAAQPRVTSQNIETSQQSQEFNTNHYYLAYVNCLEDTARKVSCLLKDSVKYGAQAYRKIINSDDVEGRQFTTKIQLLPDAQEIQKFEALMQQTIMGAPELIQFLDPFQLMRVAKEDVKLAEALFRQAQRKYVVFQQQMQQQNQQATIQGQIQSAQAAEQAKGQNLAMEMQMKAGISASEAKIQQENIATTGLWNFINVRYAPQKGTGENATVKIPDIPPDVQKLIDIAIANNIKQFSQQSEPATQDQQPEQMQPQEQPQVAA